ncbi:MAG: hypothetical protein JNK82_24775, partial [Myxococcaceae bacterium]|nr:hypothetical protein [Myxococcaceae bacterium]
LGGLDGVVDAGETQPISKVLNDRSGFAHTDSMRAAFRGVAPSEWSQVELGHTGVKMSEVFPPERFTEKALWEVRSQLMNAGPDVYGAPQKVQAPVREAWDKGRVTKQTMQAALDALDGLLAQGAQIDPVEQAHLLTLLFEGPMAMETRSRPMGRVPGLWRSRIDADAQALLLQRLDKLPTVDLDPFFPGWLIEGRAPWEYLTREQYFEARETAAASKAAPAA